MNKFLLRKSVTYSKASRYPCDPCYKTTIYFVCLIVPVWYNKSVDGE